MPSPECLAQRVLHDGEEGPVSPDTLSVNNRVGQLWGAEVSDGLTGQG